MKSILKRLSAVLALVLLSILTAAAQEVTIDSLKYRLNPDDRTASVSGYIQGIREAVIPATIKVDNVEYTIVKLDGFNNCSSLTSITIPNSVTTLGDRCFNGCSSLTSIEIPESVTSLGDLCFSGCGSLTNITLPKSVTSLDDECFSHCNLKTLYCLTKTPSICTSKTFKDFNQSTCLLYVNDVDAYRVADGWKNFTKIYKIYRTDTILADGLKYLINLDTQNATLIANTSKYSGYITVPATITVDHTKYKVTAFGDDCFNGCTNLTGIELPSTLVSLGDYCFRNCWKLDQVSMPKSLTSIGISCFNGCRGLTDVVIGKSVTTLGDSCFYGCYDMTSISLPETLKSLGNRCFQGCYELASITLPTSVTTLGNNCFNDCRGLKHIDLSPSTKTISHNCFDGCNNLTDVTIPEGVTTLDNGCFANCTRLKYITLPNTLTTIKWQAFIYCSGLKKVDLPNSVTSLGVGCFSYCSSLKEVTLSTSLTSLPEKCFWRCDSLDNVTIPESVKSLGNRCFEDCLSLTKIAIPKSVTILHEFCFKDCSSLTSIEYSDSLRELGEGAFWGCYRLNNVKLPETLTAIPNSLFQGCSSLTDINFPKSVTSFGDYAFAGCGILNMTIPETVASIGERCFTGCRDLRSVILPNSIKSLPELCFMGCTSLKSVYIPESITQLNYWCFRDCDSLQTIVLPRTFNNMSYGAFYGDSLTTIICAAQTPPIVEVVGRTFEHCNISNCTVYCPDIDAYKSAPDWGGMKEYCKLPDEVTVSVPETGYTTLYYGYYNLTVPENVSALVYNYDGSSSTLKVSMVYEPGSTIPAGTAVVIKAKKGDYKFTVSNNKGQKPEHSNLYGFDVPVLNFILGMDHYYTLGLNADNDASSIGYYWKNEYGSFFDVKAHEAFLALPVTASEKGFKFSDAITEFTIDQNSRSNDIIEGENITVTVKRTFNDNAWNSLVLPFAMNNKQLSSAFGSDAKFAKYTGTTQQSDGTYTLNFETTTEMEPNKPIFVWGANSNVFTVEGVTVVKSDATFLPANAAFSFSGVYNRTTMDEGDWYISSDNNLYKSEGYETVKATQAVFHPIGAAADANGLSFSIDGIVTGIGAFNADNIVPDSDAQAPMYNIAGQRVNSSYKGVVIRKGKKIINK